VDNLPYIDVKLEEQKYACLLDLGSKYDLSLRKSLIDSLKKKQQTRVIHTGGIRGSHDASQYKISCIKIGTKKFSKISMTEISDQFILESVIYDPKIAQPQDKLDRTPGLLGWPILTETNLILDFPNSQVCSVSSLKQAKKLGYRVENWQKVPFSIKNGIVVDVATDFGKRQLILDTGATFTVMKKALIPEEKAYEKYPGLRAVQSGKFAAGNIDFGKTEICIFDFPNPEASIDGVLGMSFLSQRVCYIDYKNKCLYFGPKQRTIHCKQGIAEFDLDFTEKTNIPILGLDVEGGKFFVAFDTNSSAELALEKEVVQKLDTKFLGDFEYQDNKGREWKINRYWAKKFNFNGLDILSLSIYERDDIRTKIADEKIHVSGIIGRCFLDKINFLFDVPRRKVYAADDLKILKQKGYDVAKWTALPYCSNDWGKVVTLETDQGKMRFLIATGTSKTLVRSSLVSEQRNYFSEKFEFEGRDFGPQEMMSYDQMPSPESIDGYLGMDFLSKYPFYIDGLDEVLYIGR